MTDCGFIDDGYTRDGIIEAEEGFHPSLSFEFRPMTTIQIRRAVKEIQKASKTKNGIEAGERKAAEIVAEHVKEWDLEDSNENVVPITTDNVLKLEPRLSGKLFRVLIGERKPTPDEDEVDMQADAKN